MNQTLQNIDIQTLLGIINVLILALIALSATGVAGMFVALRQNKHAFEMVYRSISPETQAIIRDIILHGKPIAEAVKEGFDLADEITAPGGATTITSGTVSATTVTTTPPSAGG